MHHIRCRSSEGTTTPHVETIDVGRNDPFLIEYRHLRRDSNEALRLTILLKSRLHPHFPRMVRYSAATERLALAPVWDVVCRFTLGSCVLARVVY